jgi:membrane protein
MQAKEIVSLVKDSFTGWSENKAQRLAAALAYFTIFSMAPLLIIAIFIAGQVFGEAAVEGQIVGQIEGLVGTEAAVMIQTMLENAQQPGQGLAAVIGFGTLILGASGVVGQLRDAMNTVWGVSATAGRGIWSTVKRQLGTFALVLGVGVILLALLVLTTVLAAAGGFFADVLPLPYTVIELMNWVLSLAIVAGLFALLFRYVPDVRVAWRDVWVGAFVTAFLFALGRWAIGLYLGRASPGSVYGAAGSLVVLLLWVYYSAQILLFGAEFTQAYANRYGSRIEPAGDAVPLTAEARAKQGMASREMIERAAQIRQSSGMSPVLPTVTMPTARGAAHGAAHRTGSQPIEGVDAEDGRNGHGRIKYVTAAVVSAAVLWRLVRGQNGGDNA